MIETSAPRPGDPGETTGWYLTRIESHDGKHQINFSYETETYQYPYPATAEYYSAVQFTQCQLSSGSGVRYLGIDGDSPVNTNLVEGKRLSSITTSGGTTIINFIEETTGRMDLDPNTDHPTTPAKALNYIEIINGSFDKWFDFTYSYFQSPADSKDIGSGTTSSSWYKRLKLESVQEKSVGTPTITVNAYDFDYHTSTALPQRLSRQVDSWGFYNGQSGNDNYPVNVPPTTVLIPGNTMGATYGNSNRHSYESYMLAGSLKKVTYPTKGYTEYALGANRYYYDESETDSYEIKQTITSCYESNTCCTTDEDTSSNFNLSAGEIAYAEVDVDIAFGPDVPMNCNAATRFTKIVIYNASTMVGVDSFSWGEPADSIEYPGMNFKVANEWPGVTAGSYYLTLKTTNGYGRATLKTKQAIERDVGGLRIDTIKHYDADDLLFNESTFDYTKAGSDTSSGRLYVQPVYADYTLDNSYYHLFYRDVGVVPLASFDGYHIGYERVVERKTGNGETVHWFTAESRVTPTTYPQVPELFLVKNGQADSTQVLDNSSGLLRSEANTYTSQYEYLAVQPKKVFFFKQVDGTGEITCYYSKEVSYQVRSGHNLISIRDHYSDGMLSSTSWAYNVTNQLFPISETTTNSDGRVHKTEYQYPATYAAGSIRDKLVEQNRLTPWETTKKVDNVLVDGHRTTYDFFTSAGVPGGTSTDALYPYLEYRYELTFDGTGTVVSGATWALQKTVNLMQANVGLPAEVTVDGWSDPLEYTWNLSGKPTQWDFKDYQKVYTYFSGSDHLQSFEDVDGTLITLTWDNLMRLRTNTDCKGVQATIDYHYFSTSANRNYIHTTVDYPILGTAANKTIQDVRFLDGLGNPVQNLRYLQDPASASESISSQLVYNSVGRLVETHEPKNSTVTPTGYSAQTSDYTETTYEASPLNRPIEVQPPTTPTGKLGRMQYQYGTNGSSEVYNYRDAQYYDANTLHKTVAVDANGVETHTFVDILGNTVLSRKKEGTSIANTFTLFDNKNRPYIVLPPGTTLALADTNLVYHKLYSGDDQIVMKNDPDEKAETFEYDNRELLICRQDGKMRSQGRYYGIVNDGYGRPQIEGFSNNPGGGVTDPIIFNTYGSSGITIDKLITQSKKVTGSSFLIVTEPEYDDCGRQVLTKSNSVLHPDIGSIVDSLILDDADNVVEAYLMIAEENLIVRLRNTFDHVGRTKKSYIQVTTKEQTWSEEELCDKTYTPKEQIDRIALGGGLQHINYTYLTNRYLEHINTAVGIGSATLFGLDIGYDKDIIAGSVPGTVYRHNGDISTIVWRYLIASGSAGPRMTYQYKYNYLDMLTEAEYFEHITMTSDYKTTYSYIDDRGNFDMVTRNSPAGLIDNLNYDYIPGTNQLDEIADGASSSPGSRGYLPNSDSYEHDANGFISEDPEIGGTITRDHLNLITGLEYDDVVITNSRDATGQLHRCVIDSAGITTTVDKIGILEFRNGALSVIHHDNGYVTFNRAVSEDLVLEGTVMHTATEQAVTISSGRVMDTGADEENIAQEGVTMFPPFEVKSGAEYLADTQEFPVQSLAYHYIIKDHLGSPRVIFQDINNNNSIDPATEVEDRKDYYPFGLEWDDPAPGVPQYRQSYNNKEQVSHTKYLDFGNRCYIKTANIFDGPDPISSSFPHVTTINYAENSPVANIDLWGLQKFNVTARAFIPQNTLANPNPFSKIKSFAGDSRTQYDANASSYRVEQSVSLDFDNSSSSTLSNSAAATIGFDKSGSVIATSEPGSGGSLSSSVSNGLGTVNFGIDAGNKISEGETMGLTPNINRNLCHRRGRKFYIDFWQESNGVT